MARLLAEEGAEVLTSDLLPGLANIPGCTNVSHLVCWGGGGGGWRLALRSGRCAHIHAAAHPQPHMVYSRSCLRLCLCMCLAISTPTCFLPHLLLHTYACTHPPPATHAPCTHIPSPPLKVLMHACACLTHRQDWRDIGCDVFVPCAMSRFVDDQLATRLQCRAMVGSTPACWTSPPLLSHSLHDDSCQPHVPLLPHSYLTLTSLFAC